MATDALSADHPTATLYLDESGVIKTDRFFGIGCLRVQDGPGLTRTLRRHRQVLEYHDELHWSRFDKAATVDGGAFMAATAAIDTFFDLESASFCCMLCDRQNGDITKSAGSSWKAYELLSCKAVRSAIRENEVVSVLADHTDTPPDVRFEEAVHSGVNDDLGRLAVATVARIHSHAADGLQLADLLLGASMFDFRQGAERGTLDPGSQKGQLCQYLLDCCGVTSFRPAGKEIAGKFKVEMRQRRRTRRGRRGGDRS